MQKFTLIFTACLIFCGTTFATVFPNFENFVTDTTATLSPKTVASLNAKLKNYEIETGTEIAIAIIETTGGMPIWQFATELGNQWGVGKTRTDNGAILVIAKLDRELFIATGSQLEGALTDLEAAKIIEEIITPRFRNEDFDNGISAGVDGIIAAIAGESFSNLQTESSTTKVNIFEIIFFAGFFIFPWLAAILGRSKKFWPGGALGAVGGGIGGLLLSFTAIGIAVTAVSCGIFGLIFDLAVSRNFAAAKKSGGRAAWWAGGGRSSRGNFGGGGFGGFGGGGFSGGGFGGKW